MNWSEVAHLLPIGVVLATAVVVVFLDLALKHADRFILPWVALTGLILSIASTYQTYGGLAEHLTWFRSYASTPASGTFNPLILGGSFCLDGFGLFVWIIASVAGALSVLSAPVHDDDSVLSSGEYYGLSLLAVSGMMLLAISHEFMTLLISLEIMSIATYILTGSNRTDLRSNEAALKYLVLGAFSTAFFLMGIAFYYGALGSFSLTPNVAFEQLAAVNANEAASRQLLLFVGLGFLVVGSMFKVGAAPFHFWIPDVYQGAPTPVTGLMAVGVKAAAFAVVARLVFETFGNPIFRPNMNQLLSLLAVLTMIVGNVLAMRQSNVKRMLAYSGIAHTGYLLLGFIVQAGASDAQAMEEHTRAAVFYLLVYGFMTLGAFGVLSLTREDGKPLEEMDSFTGLAKEHPALALCMAAFMLSLAGLPPLGGFFAKFLIFRGAVQEGQIVPAVIGILTSVASLYYYLRVVVQMYMPPTPTDHAAEAPAVRCRYEWSANLLIYSAAIVTLLVGVFPGWFF